MKKLVLCLMLLVAAAGSAQDKMRVIIDNDFAGDPDGLFALAQLMLSPSVDVRAVIGSHLHANENWTAKGEPAAATAAANAKALLQQLGKADVPVLAGSETALADTLTPADDGAARAIVAEAMKASAKEPLYVLCGGGLTEMASAWLLKPEIADRVILVWIGGSEYPGFTAPPGGTRGEYNTTIDTRAAQVVFNRSNLRIWQIPRNAYRQCLISRAVLRNRTKASPLGERLAGMLDKFIGPGKRSECYVLGDSPLVLVTALQSNWERDACSSAYSMRHCPTVDDKGVFHFNGSRREIKVFDRIDTYLMFEDLFAKLNE